MAPLVLELDLANEGDAVKLGGTAQTGRDIGASVLLSSGTGAGQISLTSGAVTVGTNNDKTGYTASTVSDKTGYELAASYDAAKTASQASDLQPAAEAAIAAKLPVGASAIAAAGATATTLDDVFGTALEGSTTVAQALRVLLSFVAGKTSGGGTTSITFRDQADTKSRISMTVDSSGNRSAVTVDGT